MPRRHFDGRTRSSGRRPHARRAAAAIAGLSIALVAGTAVPALAGGGTVGDPQPELVKFKVGAVGGTGTGAVTANGTLVLASPTKSGTAIVVCTLHPGGRACATTVTLQAYRHSGDPQDSFSGPIEVFATGGEDVSIVAYDCCYIGANGVTVFNSTNAGATWGPQIQAGDLGTVGAATFADGNLVVGTSEFHAGTQVQAFVSHPSLPQTSYAQASTYAGDTAMATFDGGVLVANDNLKNTRVEYAKAGKGLNSTSSYATVGVFGNEEVLAASGSALLTDPGGSLTGGVRLRLFNGSSYGAAHRAPEPKSPDDGYFAMQEVGHVVHVFFIARRSGYDVFTETTTDGVHWSPLVEFSTAITSDALSPVLGPTGAGLLFENDGAPLYAQPILNGQRVHVAFVASHVHVGHTALLRGTVAPRLPGQVVALERFLKGRWYGVKSSHETAAGTFAFTVSGVTETYRAVVADKPGYYEYGYSNAATVVAIA